MRTWAPKKIVTLLVLMAIRGADTAHWQLDAPAFMGEVARPTPGCFTASPGSDLPDDPF
ncbi:MAG: hypothetical protein OEM60_15440 [Gammaproteobacteria bacterium]|nr:hypothetical protein [Gammaproteobacteria bacterium]MDH3428661.1 hypothetical protein [Gammaproteobacteria bacterium]MDH3435256.1 hypothetical protein [Gammaproteobacteria bacterium]